jgi:hypothetical protein
VYKKRILAEPTMEPVATDKNAIPEKQPRPVTKTMIAKKIIIHPLIIERKVVIHSCYIENKQIQDKAIEKAKHNKGTKPG